MKVYLLKLRELYASLRAKKKAGWVLLLAIVCGTFIPVLPIRIAGEFLFLLWLIGWSLYTAGTVSDNDLLMRNRLLKQLITANLAIYIESPSWNFADACEDAQLAKLESGDRIRLLVDDSEYDLADVRMNPDYSLTAKIHNTTKEWYETAGYTAIEELIYDAAAQGKQEILLTHHLLPSLPEPQKWAQLIELLDADGLIATVQENSIKILTQGGGE